MDSNIVLETLQEMFPEDFSEEVGNDDPCHYCDGDGWGIIGQDFFTDDYVNGPYYGEVIKCPYCQ